MTEIKKGKITSVNTAANKKLVNIYKINIFLII